MSLFRTFIQHPSDVKNVQMMLDYQKYKNIMLFQHPTERSNVITLCRKNAGKCNEKSLKKKTLNEKKERISQV